MELKSILILLSAVINLLLFLLVYFRASKTKANIAFAYTIITILGWCLAMFMYRVTDIQQAVLWSKFLYFFPPLIPAGFLIFGLYFPNEKVKNSLVTTILAISFLCAILAFIPKAVIIEVLAGNMQEKEILFGWGYYLYLLYIPTFFSIAFFALFVKMKKVSLFARKQIRFFLLGLLAASLPAMVTNLVLPTIGIFSYNWIGQVFTVFWVSLVTYAIIRHRFLDVRFIVARSIAYSILLIWLGCLYTIGVFWTSRFLLQNELQSNQIFVYTILALFIAITFQPLKSFLERVTDKIFFKYNYDSNELLSRLSNIMATTIHLDNLTHNTLHEMTTTLHLSSGAFHVYQSNKLKQFATEGGSHKELNETTFSQFISFNKAILYDEETNEQIKESMREANISVFLPLHVKERTIGFLILGNKKSGELYSKKDMDVLTIFAPQIAISIENAQAYEEIKRFNITLKDEVEKATTNLKHANERLKELDKMKDEFVSLASHELRTPMTAIKSYVWMLLENGMIQDEKGKEYLQHTYQATDRLINLVNDMLNVSRIESGRMIIEPAPVDLGNLITDVIAEVKPAADKQGILIESNAGLEKLPLVQADANKIKQVLVNLIGNSIKFTPSGGKITITTSVNGEYVKTNVTDTGKGLLPEDMPKLFLKFGMLEKNYSSKPAAQGTGLGLYICKSIIERHGGKIGVTSDGENKGSTFGFTLKRV